MNPNTDRIDDALLALLRFSLHEQNRVWKNFDWDAMNRLHTKGLISHSMGEAKALTQTRFAQG